MTVQRSKKNTERLTAPMSEIASAYSDLDWAMEKLNKIRQLADTARHLGSLNIEVVPAATILDILND